MFAFLADFENVPSWNYAIIETRKVSEGPVGVRTIYQQVRSVPTRSEERFEVTAYDPARNLEIQGQLGPFPARLSSALDALPEGTASPIPWSSSSTALAACLGESPCHMSGRPWPPTSGKLKELLEG